MLEASLSPRRVFELLSPSLALDDAVFADYLLSDCYRLDESSPVCVELRRRSGEQIEIDIAPVPEAGSDRPTHELPATVAGLGLSYRRPASSELGLAACAALAQALRSKLGEEPRRWTVLAPSIGELAESITAEVSSEPATLDSEPDRALLLRDFDHYERLYATRPQVLQVRVNAEPAVGVSVHYPAARNGRVPNSAAVYVASTRISHRRRMRRYFGGLGCSFDDEGVPRTVPTARTYTKALRGRPGLATIRPQMIAGVGASMRPIHWGVLVRRGMLPVTVAPTWAVELHRRARDVQLLANIPCDVGMTVHDMGLHALGLHAVPASAWDELVRLALEQVRARPLSLLAGPWGVLARLAGFFEGPVTTRCWKAWRDADEPEQFERSFAPHFEALRDQLREL
ncbi:hypothetical protein DB30_05559 [Enhygromyxa salina]|uniref:Uncharacterized protein n=1 Tax=Enhygromyxa salina TaxID=215803 RepID=A0A0C2CWX7_9BACT|nr:hypothetical protein [Enhygromyxa salina]KIG15536.1 hypothetical protein DB30_05559 [Enhygromyxa salina]